MSFSWSFSPNGVPILMSATVTASETGGALATTLAWFRGALLLAPIPFEFGGVELPSVLDADSQLAVHTDARCCSGVRQCYCTECVELRNPETTLVKSSRSDAPKGFEELHKVIGSELREAIGSNFYDDILFLLNRIHDLSPNAFDEIPDLTTARALSSSNTSRPLEKLETSKDPNHWFAFYWRNKNEAIPAGEHFR